MIGYIGSHTPQKFFLMRAKENPKRVWATAFHPTWTLSCCGGTLMAMTTSWSKSRWASASNSKNDSKAPRGVGCQQSLWEMWHTCLKNHLVIFWYKIVSTRPAILKFLLIRSVLNFPSCQSRKVDGTCWGVAGVQCPVPCVMIMGTLNRNLLRMCGEGRICTPWSARNSWYTVTDSRAKFGVPWLSRELSRTGWTYSVSFLRRSQVLPLTAVFGQLWWYRHMY